MTNDTLTLDTLQAEYDRFVRAFGDGDAKAVAAFYDLDAVLMPPSEDLVAGRDAIDAYYERLFSLGYQFRLSAFTFDYPLASGSYVTVVSRFTTAAFDSEGRQMAEPADVKTLVVWRLKDGRWRIVRDIYNLTKQ